MSFLPGDAVASRACGDTQSSTNVTSRFNKAFSSSATGARENLACFRPSGRPRWDIRTTDVAPWSSANWIVGTAAAMRWLFVIVPSCLNTQKLVRASFLDRLRYNRGINRYLDLLSLSFIGTLKSTRITTRLPLRAKSFIESFAMVISEK